MNTLPISSLTISVGLKKFTTDSAGNTVLPQPDVTLNRGDSVCIYPPEEHLGKYNLPTPGRNALFAKNDYSLKIDLSGIGVGNVSNPWGQMGVTFNLVAPNPPQGWNPLGTQPIIHPDDTSDGKFHAAMITYPGDYIIEIKGRFGFDWISITALAVHP